MNKFNLRGITAIDYQMNIMHFRIDYEDAYFDLVFEDELENCFSEGEHDWQLSDVFVYQNSNVNKGNKVYSKLAKILTTPKFQSKLKEMIYKY